MLGARSEVARLWEADNIGPGQEQLSPKETRVEVQTPWRPMAEEAPKEKGLESSTAPQDDLVSDGGSPESWWVGGELDSSLLLKELSVLTPPGPQAAGLCFLGIKGLREAGSRVGGGPLRSPPARRWLLQGKDVVFVTWADLALF